MKAYRLKTGSRIECLNDPVGETLIRNLPLSDHQQIAAKEAACDLIDVTSEAEIPKGEPRIVFPDDLYLSRGMLKAFLEGALANPETPGILAIVSDDQTEKIAPTQDITRTDAFLLYPVRYRVPGNDSAPTPVPIDIHDGLKIRNRVLEHVLSEGETVQYVTSKSILQIITPMHLHMANMLSILNHAAYMTPRGFTGLIFRLVRRLAKNKKPKDPGDRAPPKMFYKLLKKMNRIGKNCDIHPTALIEGSVIGDNVRIAANSIVQFSHIADNVQMNNDACVFASCIGSGTQLVTREWISMSVVYPNVFLAPRHIQFALIGRDAQVFPSLYYDYRMDQKPLKTPFRGKLVDSNMPFLGPVIGHRAKVAGGLILGPGRVVPNGAILYPNENTVINRIPDGLQEGQVIQAGS